jgi:hypothetical protein
VIDFLLGIVVELVQEGFLDKDRRRANAGFLIGWIAAQLLPPSSRAERRVFERLSASEKGQRHADLRVQTPWEQATLSGD